MLISKITTNCKHLCILTCYKYSSDSTSKPIFKGLDGESVCLKKSFDGPEPNYQKLKPNTFNTFNYKNQFNLNSGGVLPEINIAYETWGNLNDSKSNAILLFTGLSANSHAKSTQANPSPGWWEEFIGENYAIDTNKFFVICCNHLGSCFGSTGPSSINPLTNGRYASKFPIITVSDMIQAQFLLLDQLGINQVYASIGSSLGGMCSMLSGLKYPDRVGKIIAISSCARANPTSIAMRYLQRKAIMLDVNWKNGNYYDESYPLSGIRLAREIATVTYRSGPEWNQRFGRKLIDKEKPIDLCPSFEIENYLNYQGETFSTKYDPNSLLYLSKAMDLFDISYGYPSMINALSNIKCPVMIMGAKTDALFPIEQQRELSHLLKESGNNSVTYFEMDSLYGHDTFLLNLNDVGTAIKGFLEAQLINMTKGLSKTNLK